MATSNLPFATSNPTDFRQKLAEMMVSKGIDTSPVQSWTQGAARMANALVGGMQLNDLRNDQTAAGDFESKLALAIMNNAGGGASASPVAPSMPSVSTPGPTVPNDSNAMPGQVGMDLRLADRSQDFLQDFPNTTMSSGVRSTADQQRLYDNRASNPNPVARPGTSRHERGMAIDIGGMTPDQRALLPQYGLAQPVPNDPPHVELSPTPAPYQVAGPAVAPPSAAPAAPAPQAQPGTINPALRQIIAEGLQSKNPMIRGISAQYAFKLGDPSAQIGLALKQAQLEKIRRENSTAGNEVYGTPIFGTDANGNPVVGAIGKNGSFKQLDTNGVKVSTGVDKIDLGTQYAIYDKKSGNLIGYQPKDLKGAESAKAEGKAQGAAVAEYQSITSKMPGLEKVVKDLDDLSNRATYTTAGQMVDAGARQLNLPPRDAAIARAEYVSKVDNQILPLLRDTFGAQFTEREGATLRATLGDPNKSPQEKQAVLRSFIEQKRRDVEAMGSRIGKPASAPSANDPLGLR